MHTRFFRQPKGPHLGRRRFVEAISALFAGAIVVDVHRARAEDPGEFRVIVHAENPSSSVTRRFLAEAFLKDVSRWDDGEAIHPLDLRVDSAIRARFSERVIKRSVAAVRNYWQQRIFTGRGLPPPELDSDEEVVRRVHRDRGAVGYVSARADIGKARSLTVSYD